MGQCKRGQGEGLNGGSGLCPYQQLAAIEALDPDPGKRPQRKGNDLPREAYDAKQQRRMGQVIDQPGCRQPCHPVADHGDALAEKEKLEVAVPQRSPSVRHRASKAPSHCAIAFSASSVVTVSLNRGKTLS